eukprot:1119362-Pelagomonas_calceolata.AAC.3
MTCLGETLPKNAGNTKGPTGRCHCTATLSHPTLRTGCKSVIHVPRTLSVRELKEEACAASFFATELGLMPSKHREAVPNTLPPFLCRAVCCERGCGPKTLQELAGIEKFAALGSAMHACRTGLTQACLIQSACFRLLTALLFAGQCYACLEDRLDSSLSDVRLMDRQAVLLKVGRDVSCEWACWAWLELGNT